MLDEGIHVKILEFHGASSNFILSLAVVSRTGECYNYRRRKKDTQKDNKLGATTQHQLSFDLDGREGGLTVHCRDV